jgi:hypothetical protein
MRKILIFYFLAALLFFCHCSDGVDKEPVVLNGIISPGEIETYETFYIKYIWMGGG